MGFLCLSMEMLFMYCGVNAFVVSAVMYISMGGALCPERTLCSCCVHAVRRVGYFGPVFPYGQGDP